MANYNVYAVEVNLSHDGVQYGKCYLNLTPMKGNEKVTLVQVNRILKASISNIVSIKEYVPSRCISEGLY